MFEFVKVIKKSVIDNFLKKKRQNNVRQGSVK